MTRYPFDSFWSSLFRLFILLSNSPLIGLHFGRFGFLKCEDANGAKGEDVQNDRERGENYERI